MNMQHNEMKRFWEVHVKILMTVVIVLEQQYFLYFISCLNLN